MLKLITPLNQHENEALLDEMYGLRFRALIKHEGWSELDGTNEREIDDFDTENSYYLLSQVKRDSPVVGCVRFVSSEHPTLSSEIFPHLFATAGLPVGRTIFDVSRFVIDPALRSTEHLSPISNELFCGWMEFGKILGLRGLTAVIDMRHLQAYLAQGWAITPLGLPARSDNSEIIGVEIPTDEKNLAAMRASRGVIELVLSREQEIDLLKAREIELANSPAHDAEIQATVISQRGSM